MTIKVVILSHLFLSRMLRSRSDEYLRLEAEIEVMNEEADREKE